MGVIAFHIFPPTNRHVPVIAVVFIVLGVWGAAELFGSAVKMSKPPVKKGLDIVNNVVLLLVVVAELLRKLEPAIVVPEAK